MAEQGARRLLLGLAILGTVTTLPGAAARGDTPPGLQAAIRAYDRGNVEQAERLLVALVGKLQGTAQARAWLYLGLSQAGRGKHDVARKSFAAALRLEPSLDVDRERVAPPILRTFDEVRGRVTGVLEISTAEKGARVFVDGKRRGAAPLKLRLAPGEHRIQVRSPDGRRASEVAPVRVGAGAIARFRPVLRTLTGRVALRLQPPGARVLLGTKPLLAKGGVVTLPAGEHVLTIQRDGFAPDSRSVRVLPGKTVELKARLSALTAAPSFWTPARTWGVVSGGLAVALGGIGLILGSSAKGAESDIHSGQESQSINYDQYLVLADKASSRARWANVLFGAAGAAAVTAVVLLVTGGQSRPRDQPRASWRVFPTPTGAGVAVDF